MVKTLKIKQCSNADACRKCLKICPVGALILVPVGRMKSYSEKPKYKIQPHFEEVCTKCNECVEVCPQKAICFK